MTERPTPDIDERFVIKPRFKGRVVRMLNADGHIDVAHKMGLVSLKTEMIDSHVEELDQINDEGEHFKSRTRWATVVVTAQVRAPDGSIIECDGIACVSDRDKFVKVSGYEIAVAETRAIKRALASACNITEAFISPNAKEATREFVDMPLGKDDEEAAEKANLPDEVLRRPDIHPPIDGIPMRESNPEDQFSL